MLAKNLEILNEFQYALHPPLYVAPFQKGWQDKKEEVVVLDSQQVLPELPKGIPFIQEAMDQEKQMKAKRAIHQIRVFLFHELSLKNACCGGQGFKHHRDSKQVVSLFGNAFHNQMVFLLQPRKSKEGKVKGEWVLPLDFPSGLQWKSTCEPLGTKIYLVHDAPSDQMKIKGVRYQGTYVNPSRVKKEEEWNRLLQIMMCSFSTHIIMKMHFLYCHMLCGMAVFNTACVSFSKLHPMFQFMYPHGHQVNYVNMSKGSTLIQFSFGADFSFPRTELEPLFRSWMKQYHIQDLYPPVMFAKLGFDRDNLYMSSVLRDANTIFHIIQTYVQVCIQSIYPSEKEFAKDTQVHDFLKRLSELPFDSIFKKPKLYSLDHLIKIMTTWFFVSIYMHFENGDEGKDLMHFATINVPKKKDFLALVQSQQAKTFFDLIFDAVIKPTYLLKEKEWIACLPLPFQKPALEMQTKLVGLHDKIELGINK